MTATSNGAYTSLLRTVYLNDVPLVESHLISSNAVCIQVKVVSRLAQGVTFAYVNRCVNLPMM